MYFDFPYLILSHFNNVILMSIWILGGLKPVKKKKKEKKLWVSHIIQTLKNKEGKEIIIPCVNLTKFLLKDIKTLKKCYAN